MPSPTSVDFYFSPTCPWAWRTALWMRQVAAEGLVNVDWKLFNLHPSTKGVTTLPMRTRSAIRLRSC